jgi:hypothetical protein
MFGLANPELAINLTEEAWQTTYMITGNETVVSVANATSYATSYVIPNNTWTCSLEDDLNNVSFCRLCLTTTLFPVVYVRSSQIMLVMYKDICSLICCHTNSHRGVRGRVVKVVDFKPLAPHRCGFESRQGLWILSC